MDWNLFWPTLSLLAAIYSAVMAHDRFFRSTDSDLWNAIVGFAWMALGVSSAYRTVVVLANG